MANIWPTTKVDGEVVPDEEWNGIVDFGVQKPSAAAFGVGRVIFSNGTNAIKTSNNFTWNDSVEGLAIGLGTPATALHIGLNGAHGSITLQEETSTPANPSSGSQGRIYLKADKVIFQFNDGGTVRYKYLDLTGTGVTWVQTTVAP